jgi:amidase
MKHITRKHFLYKIGPNDKPVLTIDSGEIVVFDMEDGFSGVIRSNEDSALSLDMKRVLPATGPVYIKGAMPGDILVIQIKKIELDTQGAVLVLGGGVLGHKIKGPYTKVTPIIEGNIRFSEDIVFPVRPMIGFVSVAPLKETVTLVPGNHGGNMDNTDLTNGSTIYLPVFVEGGLVCMGDLHATMGDGEICGMGIECAGEVTAKIDLIKCKKLGIPRIETSDYVMSVGSAEELNEAIKITVDDMVDLLREVKGLTPEEAYTLTSIASDLKFCQVVNRLVTVRMMMPKNILPTAIP